jgi:hypothetical protein
MEAQRTRQSDRVTVELPIQLSGTDASGVGFVEDSRTAVISRHGAKILSKHTLVPEQELTIRCLATRKESDTRVVGKIGEGPEGYFYGVECLDPEVNLWDIEFPPLTESEIAVARVLLECVRCHTRELTYLDAPEAEVFEANQALSRACKRCTDMSIWKLSPVMPPTGQIHLPGPPQAISEPSSATPTRTQNERKEVRVHLAMTACIRHSYLGEEIVRTEDVSRGGFRFKSCNHYSQGSVIEVALPYSPGAANIFVPARIEHADELPAGGLTSYGVSYIHVHKGWAGN